MAPTKQKTLHVMDGFGTEFPSTANKLLQYSQAVTQSLIITTLTIHPPTTTLDTGEEEDE